MPKELPSNWLATNLKNLFYYQKGKKPKKLSEIEFQNSVPYLDIKAFEKNDIRRFADPKSSNLIYPNQLGIVWDGARSGWVTKGKYGAVGSTIAILKPIKISENFALYFLQSKFEYINSNTRGSGIPHVNPDILWNIQFPLPPLAEQERIVAKLDDLFGKLDKIKASLDHIPVLLKNFRQQVLTQAVTGKLTEEWREGKNLLYGKKILDEIKINKNKILKEEVINGVSESKRILRKIDNLDFEKPKEQIPENWVWTCMLESCLKVVDCHNKTAPYVSDGIRLLRTTNIKKGKIELEGSKFITEKTYDYWSKRCPPRENDILFTREAPMGEAAIIPKGMKVCMGQRMMLIRTIPELLNPKFLLYNILSFSFQQRMISNAIGTGVKHLRVGDVERLTFPIPSVKEQQEIVKRVECLFAKADVIEAHYKALKTKIEHLPQAILHKAFKGELVPQLESDGDAQDLLREIEALKAEAAPTTKKKTKKKTYTTSKTKLSQAAESESEYGK